MHFHDGVTNRASDRLRWISSDNSYADGSLSAYFTPRTQDHLVKMSFREPFF